MQPNHHQVEEALINFLQYPIIVILQLGKYVGICTFNTCKRVHLGQNIINHKHIFARVRKSTGPLV
jgi:hypothetical protein